MRLIVVAAAMALGSLSAPALAHPEDEFVETTPPPISFFAQRSIERLVREDQLPASWNSAKLMGQELRTKDGRMQWVVIYENAAERRRSKRMLYVLLSTTGSFISADHKLT